jgi:hypothetical protein
MVLSQLDIQSADLCFDPPLTKIAANRKVILRAAQGALLEGIKSSRKKGLIIPSMLNVTNREEHEGPSGSVQQPISEITREVLANRIREELKKGVPLWSESRVR